MITTLYLVRHGETDLNVAARCQGRLDVPMNEVGEHQMDMLAKRLSAINFDVAYSSPLQRAVRSAEILLGSSDARVVSTDELCELSYGEWQGQSHAKWPAGAAEQWENAPWDVTFPGGESLYQVRDRALPALLAIVGNHPGETVLVTAHGHLNRVLLTALTDAPNENFWRIAQPNAATWKLVFETEEGRTPRLIHAAAWGEILTATDAQRSIDAKTKPLGALGRLESCAVQLAVLQQTLAPTLQTARVCVFAADHGVAVHGVSAYPRAVTAQMMRNFNDGGAAINILGRVNNVQVEVIDVGVDANLLGLSGVRHEKVRHGTRDIVQESALSEMDLREAMAVGARAVRRAVREGAQAIGLGEMGIGNTTAAAALLGALIGGAASDTVGIGTGISPAILEHKRELVSRALALHGVRSEARTARECLRRVGGLELAAIAGAAIEACQYPIAIVADGFISTVSILAAVLILQEETPGCAHALAERIFVAHRSSEQAHQLAVEELSTRTGRHYQPLLDLEMRLGEGSGAALAMPILRSAAAVMCDMATFESAGVSSHTEQQEPLR